MSEFKTLSARECAERILKVERPLVLMHVRPDGDTVGAGIALCEIFKALGRSPRFICEDPIPERLSFLIRAARCAEPSEAGKYEVIAVDVASPKQAGSLLERLPAPSLMIDHHGAGEPFADHYTLPELSSAGEAVYNVFEELENIAGLRLTKEIAYPLYAAISSDTACMRYSSATEATYRKAARLIATGIDHSDINHRLFESKSHEQIKAEGFVASKLRTACRGRVAYAAIARREREALGVSLESLETAIDVVRSLAGVEVSFIVKEDDAGELRASLRSTGQNVAALARRLGGGGHVRAAGCSVEAKDAASAAELLSSLVAEEFFREEPETRA